jgi:hypothetical protein
MSRRVFRYRAARSPRRSASFSPFAIFGGARPWGCPRDRVWCNEPGLGHSLYLRAWPISARSWSVSSYPQCEQRPCARPLDRKAAGFHPLARRRPCPQRQYTEANARHVRGAGRRHRLNTAALLQDRSDPAKSPMPFRVAGRAALLLRNSDARQGCLGRGFLLRDLSRVPRRGAARNREHGDRRYGGCSRVSRWRSMGITRSILMSRSAWGSRRKGYRPISPSAPAGALAPFNKSIRAGRSQGPYAQPY